jgi:hypothetical protein
MTLLVVTAGQLVRADFAPGSTVPSSVRSAARPPGSDPAGAVRVALALGGRGAARTWVLCEDIWTQAMALPRSQVAGLTGEQLAQALSFEVEALSGVPSHAAALGFHATQERDGQVHYWIAEMLLADRDAVGRVVREAGGRLAGLIHPSALPQPLAESTTGAPWQRLEQWSRGMVWIRCSEAGQMHIQNVASARPVQAWPPGADDGEWLDDGRSGTAPSTSARSRHSLGEERALGRWLQAWAAVLRSADPCAAIVKPPPHATPLRHVIMAGVAAEIAVLLLCALHAHCARLSQARLQDQLAALSQPARSVEEVSRQNATMVQALADRRLAEEARAALAVHRFALAALLRSLAVDRPEDVVIQGIETDAARNLSIRGVSLEASSVEGFAARLAERLVRSGWNAQLRAKKAQQLLDNGGPWEFGVDLVRIQPAPGTPAATGGKP